MLVLAGVVVVAAAVAGCGGGGSWAPDARTGVTPTTTKDPSSGPSQPRPPRESSSATILADPDLDDVPFDPCAVFTWQDFPPEVRPAADVPVEPRPPQPKVIDCMFGYSIDAAAGGAGQPPDPKRVFVALVSYGVPPAMSADPAEHQADSAQWAGRSGVRKPTTAPDGAAACAGYFPVAEGVGGVSLVNSLYPQVDTCGVVDVLMTTLATRVP